MLFWFALFMFIFVSACVRWFFIIVIFVVHRGPHCWAGFPNLSLHHLILKLTIIDLPWRKIDVLDLACLLEAAPFMEKLELHVSLSVQFFRYISVTSRIGTHQVVVVVGWLWPWTTVAAAGAVMGDGGEEEVCSREGHMGDWKETKIDETFWDNFFLDY